MSSTTRIKITHARRHLCQVVRDIEEGRRSHVVITRGELPVVALVPCTPDGTPRAARSDDFSLLSPKVRAEAAAALRREMESRFIAEESGGAPWPPKSEEAL